MDVFTLCGVALVTAALAATLKQYRPELALQVGIAGGAVILLMALTSLGGAISAINAMLEESGLGGEWFALIVKIVGIAYITQITAEICRDAGEGALACKTEICGRVMILTCALPAVLALLRAALGIAENM